MLAIMIISYDYRIHGFHWEGKTINVKFQSSLNRGLMLSILYFDTKHYLLTKYAKDDKNLVVVKNPITGIPLQTIDGIQVPGVGKIPVGLIVDKELFASRQGRD